MKTLIEDAIESSGNEAGSLGTSRSGREPGQAERTELGGEGSISWRGLRRLVDFELAEQASSADHQAGVK